MTDFYMTPGGAGLNDGASPANAFDWAGYDAWQTAALPGDTLYVGPGNYVGTSRINAGTDGTAADYIQVVGVSSLSTLAEAEDGDRPLFALNPAVDQLFDNFWDIRNLRVTGAEANPTLRVDQHSRISNCDVVNTVGDAIFLGGSASEAHRCRASSPLASAFGANSFSQMFLGCIAYDSLIGFESISSRNGMLLNLAYGCTTGLALNNSDAIRVIGNTIYNCATAITGSGVGTSDNFLRNIIANCPASAVWTAAQDTDWWDWNNWFNSGTPVNVTQGSRATFLDPQFVDPATFDFRVRTEALRNITPTLYTFGAIAPSIYEGGETNISGTTDPDFSQDQLFRHGLETVTLDGAEVQNVYRNPELEVEQEPTDGVYVSRNVTFDFPFGEDLYALGRPQIKSLIIDGDDNAYVIQTIRHPYMSDFWGCEARSIVIAGTFDLDNEVTLYPAVYTDDAYGSKITKQAVADATFTDVAASIRLVHTDARLGDDLAGQKQFLEQYEIYVAEDIGQVNQGDVLKDENGKVYEIVAWRNRDRMDELAVILCEVTRVGAGT